VVAGEATQSHRLAFSDDLSRAAQVEKAFALLKEKERAEKLVQQVLIGALNV